jgi:hypothetical protein
MLKLWHYKVRYILVLQIYGVDKYLFTIYVSHITNISQLESILVLYGYFIPFYALKKKILIKKPYNINF